MERIIKSSHYSKILIVFIVLGLLSGMYLVWQRHHVEQQVQQVENIVDYDKVVRSAILEERSLDTILADLKEAGVTAFAIYDQTLQKLADDGSIVVLRGADLWGIPFYDGNLQPDERATYILPIRGHEQEFEETRSALVQRLGASKVGVRATSRGPAIEIFEPYSELLKINLSLSRVQAEEIINKGFHVILRPTSYANVTREDIKFTLDRMEGLPNLTGIVFTGKDVLGYPDQLPYLVDRLHAMRIPIVGIEATDQLQYDRQNGYLELAKMEGYRTGRLFAIGDDYLKKLLPDEVAQQFYISDIERNVRYNLLPIYEKGMLNMSPLDASLFYMKELKGKLLERGFEIGRASIYPEYKPHPLYVFVTMMGAMAMFFFTVKLLLPIKNHHQLFLFALSAFVSLILFYVTSASLIKQVWAFAAGVSAPVAAMTLCMDSWVARKRINANQEQTQGMAIVQTAVYVVVAAAISYVGGVFIAAILGSTEFFMEYSLYRGVKATFLLPVLLTIVAYMQRFPLWRGQTIKRLSDWKYFCRSFLHLEVKMYAIMATILVAFIAWIYIGRSGHTAGVPVPQFELILRRFLEDTMFARPRGKEFLIGYPAFMLAGYALLRKWPLVLHFLFTIGGVIAIGSLVETFAHIRTPVIMSLVRGLGGLGLGIVVGIIAIIFLEIAIHLYRSFDKREGLDE